MALRDSAVKVQRAAHATYSRSKRGRQIPAYFASALRARLLPEISAQSRSFIERRLNVERCGRSGDSIWSGWLRSNRADACRGDRADRRGEDARGGRSEWREGKSHRGKIPGAEDLSIAGETAGGS